MRDRAFGRWISLLNRYGHIYTERHLKQYNIGSGQYVFLMALYGKDGVSQEELSRAINIDKGTTAKAIQKLEKEGYITRRKDPGDKRAYRVYLTPKALEIKNDVVRVLQGWSDVIALDFTGEEKAVLADMLKRMAHNAAHYSGENREKR